MTSVPARFTTEPAAVYVTAFGTIAAIIVAAGHLDATKAGALSTAATAIGTIATALLARPWHVAVIGGAAGMFLQALIVFGVPLTAVQIAVVVQVVSLTLGLTVMRPNLTPVAAARNTGSHALKAVP